MSHSQCTHPLQAHTVQKDRACLVTRVAAEREAKAKLWRQTRLQRLAAKQLCAAGLVRNYRLNRKLRRQERLVAHAYIILLDVVKYIILLKVAK